MKIRNQTINNMTVQDLFNLAGGRELSKSFPKADGFYIWDYKVVENIRDSKVELELIQSDTGKVGFSDKVSLQEIAEYLNEMDAPSPLEIEVTGAEGITLAKV